MRSVALTVFVVAALFNLALDLTGHSQLAFLTMGVPVWALCARLVATIPVRRSRWVLAALLLGSGGDVVLAAATWTHPVLLFLCGMGLFLAGHLCYIAAFAPGIRLRTRRGVPAALVLAFGVAASVTLVRVLGVQAVPIVAYACALCGMAVTAILQRSERLLVPFGAGLFLLSDALLGVNRFLHPLPLESLWTLLTYWAAQFLLSEGWAADQQEARAD